MGHLGEAEDRVIRSHVLALLCVYRYYPLPLRRPGTWWIAVCKFHVIYGVLKTQADK